MLALKVEEGATRQGPWAPPDAGKGQDTDSALESPEGTSPADTFFRVSDLQSRQIISHSVGYSGNREQYTYPPFFLLCFLFDLLMTHLDTLD